MHRDYEYQNNEIMNHTVTLGASRETLKSPSIFEHLGQLDKLSSEIKAKAEQIRGLVGPTAEKTDAKELGPANNITSNLYFLNTRLQDINTILGDALYTLVSK